MVGRNCLELLRGVVVFDTTTVLTGHIISSHTDLDFRVPLGVPTPVVGNSEQCETEMLFRRPSLILRHRSIDVLLGIKHSFVSWHYSLYLLLGIAPYYIHVALETVQSTGTEMKNKFCKNSGSRLINYCVIWYWMVENGYARMIVMFCESRACVIVWTHWGYIQKSEDSLLIPLRRNNGVYCILGIMVHMYGFLKCKLLF